jgi:amino acid adenylation domain-containing protein
MSLLSAFKRQCDLSPNNIAFVEGDRQCSYQHIQQSVHQLSTLLLHQDDNVQRVAIALDRGIDAAISILAVLNAAACYVPLDLKNPSQRLNFIVNDADVQRVIGKGQCPDWLDNQQCWLNIEQLPQSSGNKTANISADSLAAILYTSGSTGNPKGVALSHYAMQNFSDWAADTFTIKKSDRIASLAPFHFDLSILDIFSSLSQGASIYFVPSHLILSPSRLTSWLSIHHITLWYTVPSLLNFITLKGALDKTPFPHLKSILFAGEVFPSHQLIKLCQLLPRVAFYNLYGPTETNVCCYWPVQATQLLTDQPIPIGIPACHSTLKIDPQSNELQVKSRNNLSGYWQQGKLIPALSDEQYYATGDKVSINEQGQFCYHGRLDRMLKCSGYRVEPAEIEHVLLQHPAVENCAVIGIKDSTSGQRPAVAMVLSDKNLLSDIVKCCKQQLPSYMQPSQFIVFDTLPYLSNQKIDYLSLQKQMELR